MNILITNDDGIESEGLIVLKSYLEQEHDVWVAAPDRERSAVSHAITLRSGVTFAEVADREFACSGTPADCVLYALLGVLPFTPELIVSGINDGPNIGTDIIYSGTVAAARQASLMGYPSVAVSLVAEDSNKDFSPAASFILQNAATLTDLWSDTHFINVNVPNRIGSSADVWITHPAKRIYGDRLVLLSGIDGSRTYTLEGESNHAENDEGSDWDAVSAGAISISPIRLHPLNESENQAYHSTRFVGPETG